MKVSEHIKYFQRELERWGDGEIFSLGEFSEHEPPPSIKCELDEEYEYKYDMKK